MKTILYLLLAAITLATCMKQEQPLSANPMFREYVNNTASILDELERNGNRTTEPVLKLAERNIEIAGKLHLNEQSVAANAPVVISEINALPVPILPTGDTANNTDAQNECILTNIKERNDCRDAALTSAVLCGVAFSSGPATVICAIAVIAREQKCFVTTDEKYCRCNGYECPGGVVK